LTCVPGVIQYEGAEIQLLDLPGIIEGMLWFWIPKTDFLHFSTLSIVQGAAQGKGRGRQVIAVARTADMVLMMLDATKSEVQRRLLEEELEGKK
jgi:ribosome-interacting GTPase 1